MSQDDGKDESFEENKRLVHINRDFYIIRKAVEQQNECGAESALEYQLDYALEHCYQVIVIEPDKLGTEIASWIRIGNFFHKGCVLMGVIAILTNFIRFKVFPLQWHTITVPLGLASIGCAAMYGASWQYDPCSKYQLDHHGLSMANIPTAELTTDTSIVLVRKNDIYRKRLHNSVAIFVCLMFGWQLYKRYYT